MKNKIWAAALCIAAVVLAGGMLSFDKPADEPNATGEYSPFDYRKDTITNAGKDTLWIGKRPNSSPTAPNTIAAPTNFLSLYTYDISIARTSLSGTANLKIYIDKSDMRSGTSTDWVLIDSAATTTATNVQIRSTDATAVRYRLRISGTGTQSSTYQIWSIWKKKN